MKVREIIAAFEKAKPDFRIRAIFEVGDKYVVSACPKGENPKIYIDGCFQVSKDGKVSPYSPMKEIILYKKAIQNPIYKGR